MDEQQQSRAPIPPWVWVVGLVAIFLALQFWASGSFNSDEQLPLPEVARLVDEGQVRKIEVSGNQLLVTLNDGETFESFKENDIFDTFDALGVDQEAVRGTDISIQDVSLRNTLFSVGISLLPILILIWIFTRGFRQIQSGGNSIFGFGRSKAKNLNEGDRPTVTFDDVAGVDEAKEEVEEIVQFLREPERFVQVGARIPKGVLMVGPPGTGKTLLARAIAGEAGVPFFHISGSEFVEMFVGVGASRVRDLFNKAKENAPAIVFVDEIDAVGRQRGAGLGGGHDEREQTLNQILTEMDGFSNETNVIVIAATNRADVLDPALLRPGRFDRKVIVDLPDLRGREKILKVHARGKPLSKDVNLNDVARLTAGFSGADLENLLNESAIFTARRGGNLISMTDMQDAFDRIAMGGPERKSRAQAMSEEEKEIVAYHEAGHAVVGHFLPYMMPVQKVTIIPRGRAGGYTLYLPDEKMVTSVQEIEDMVATTLGGRAAEEIFFGLVSTGASGDLQQVTRYARAMIMQYGMSEELGLRSYGEQSGNIFLGRTMTYDRDYSEEAARKIDEEIRKIVDRNYQRAHDILNEHRDKVIRLSDALVEHETVDRPLFEELMNEEPKVSSEEDSFVPAD
ncbi:MAG: ATP-dependent zinc metalloprotease FtsH [Ardenticatenaceae bacterium]|nr:ATP-dependent zinc metalloprotease FtsH [Ardenticatenaceae bacterium]